MNVVYVCSYFLIPLVMISPAYMLPRVQWVELTLDIFLFVDLLVDFFQGYYDDTELIMDHKKIVLHYLSGYFIVECISVCPGLFTGETIHQIYFLKAVRYIQFSRFMQFVESGLLAVSL